MICYLAFVCNTYSSDVLYLLVASDPSTTQTDAILAVLTKDKQLPDAGEHYQGKKLALSSGAGER